MKCENPNHKGNPLKNQGKGYWWLKNPEWKYWCPKCTQGWIKDEFRKATKDSQSNEKESK